MNIFARLWRWHPEVALRYLPIIAKIRQSGLNKPSILEIGSGSLGITPYIGKQVTGLDINFSGPQTDLLTKVNGNAVNINFPDKSFAIVLSVDVIEHLPKKLREQAISEALRVASKLLIIAAPAGSKSIEEDQYLARHYFKIHQKSFPFYQEHQAYGLPQRGWMEKTIVECAHKMKKRITAHTEGNINLSLHRILMKGWITKSPLQDLLFRKVMLVAIPLFRTLNHRPYYREIVYCKIRD